MSTKVTRSHLERTAFVYVRQSTMKQVQEHKESQYNQYALAARAQALGWAPQRLRVIDADLGQSGQSGEGRAGFQELVAEVSLGRAGIVLGLEVSRLARNCRDWYQLLEVCALWGTLIGDADGVYDPREYNDRLLLGLKGTMSEAELHLLRCRMDAGRMSQVRRGDYMQRLPTGYVRERDGTVVQDPDAQVRAVLELVFGQFDRLGSVPKLLRFLRDQQILLPRRQVSGPQAGELLWRRPSSSMLLSMLQNPAYAGAFVYGRKQSDPRRKQPGHPSSGRVRRSQEEWLALHKNHYPPYISWEEYEVTQTRLHDNASRYAEGHKGAPRQGVALLQGLAVCGRCGYHMHVGYRAEGHRYLCHALAKNFAGPSCACLAGPAIDAAVVGAFFQALQPAQLDLLDRLLAEQVQERQQVERLWQQRLERCRYEAQLARRQYDVVDPENRLVAGELERRWEEKLAQQQEAEEGHRKFQGDTLPSRLEPGLRAQLEALSSSLPDLWHSGSLASAEQKALLRTLIRQVVLQRVAPDLVQVRVVWISGHVSTLKVSPRIHRLRDLSCYQKMVDRVSALFDEGRPDAEIAGLLQEEGCRPARSDVITPELVGKLRRRQGLFQPIHLFRRQQTFGDDHWTVRGLSKELGVGRNWLYFRIHRGIIPAVRHPATSNYLIPKDDCLLESLQQQRKGKAVLPIGAP